MNKFYKNFISLSSVNLISLLIPILTLPILTRSLGVEGYGILMLINTVNLFGVVFIEYSSQTFGVREIKTEKNIQFFFSELQSARLSLLLIYMVFVTIYMTFFVNYVDSIYIFFILMYLLGTYFTAHWFHLSNSDLLIVSILSISARLMNLFGIVFYVSALGDLFFCVFISTVPVFISGFTVYVYRRYKYKLKELKYVDPFPVLRNGFPMFVSDFAPNLYNNIPVIVYGSLSTPSQFALLSLSMRLVNVISLLQNIIMKSAYPLMLERNVKLSLLVFANICLSLFLIALIFLYKDEVLIILTGGDSFFGALKLIDILLFGVFFNGLIYSFTFGYLYKAKVDVLLSKVMLKVCFLSSVLVFYLLYVYGDIGLVSGLTIARLLVSISLFYLVLKIKGINLRLGF